MTIQEIKTRDLLLFETISGSQAYGTNVPTSDTDFKGVFLLPKNEFLGLDYIEQVNDATNDKVYYELGRFMELLAKSNPNILEMLAMPEDCIQYQHPVFEQLKPEYFLSKECRKTFAGYAMAQVKKARGLNKKIVNPMGERRKNILEFCFVIQGHGTVPLLDWLAKKGLQQEKCGLVNLPNFRDAYAIFYDEKEEFGFSGIMKKETANEVALSSIPKGLTPIGTLSFNKSGYQTYCKSYREYWSWVEKRNESRYENTLAHGKNYDAKNMMHTFRLLDMAEEIALGKGIVVRRPNREFLLKIRKGDFEYADLVAKAEAKIEQVDKLFDKSNLPEKPDYQLINNLLVEMRSQFY